MTPGEARCLGAGRHEDGEGAVSVAFFTGFILGTCLGVFCLFHIDQVVMLLGATETIKPFAVEYARSGAAIATGLSQFISFCILLAQCNLRRECIHIRIGNFRPSLFLFRQNLKRRPALPDPSGYGQYCDHCVKYHGPPLWRRCHRGHGHRKPPDLLRQLFRCCSSPHITWAFSASSWPSPLQTSAPWFSR